MAMIRTTGIRNGLRAVYTRPVTSPHLQTQCVRGIRTEKPTGSGEGMGGSASNSYIVPVAAGLLGVGGVFYFFLGTPEKAASVPRAPGSTADEVQRKGIK